MRMPSNRHTIPNSMKSSVITLLATIFISFSASAAPMLLIETSIAEPNAKGEKDILSKPSIIVESGKQATINFGTLKYSLIPTLRDNGTVDIETVITERNGKETTTLAKPRMIVELGKSAEVTLGQVSFTAKPSIRK